MKFSSAAVLLVATMPIAASDHIRPVYLGELSHIHGVVLPSGSQDVLVATHNGLFAVDPSGSARMVSAFADDFMGFTSGPDGRLYASGHPADGGNTGIVAADSIDAPWMHLSAGAGGPVDFHAMTVSPSDPAVLYGSFNGIQVSRDAGRTWSVTGSGPDDLLDLAAASDAPDHLYAGTMTGLFESTDAGASWSRVGSFKGPVSSVEVAPSGDLHAFVVKDGLYSLRGTGLVKVGNLPNVIVLHMAFDPVEPALMVAVTSDSDLLSSNDGGRSWSAFLP